MLALLSLTSEATRSGSDQYTIKEIYEIMDHTRGAVVLTTSGALTEADQLLVPARMKEGTYQVTVTEKAKISTGWIIWTM